MRDYNKLVGKRVKIGISEPFELHELSPVYGHVISQYVSYEELLVLEIELDQEVDWGEDKAKRIVVLSRFVGHNLLSILDGGDMSVNIFLTKYRLSQPPPEKPNFVGVGWWVKKNETVRD